MPKIHMFPYATMKYAEGKDIPMHFEYSHHVPGSESALRDAILKYNSENPDGPGYLCWTPEFGIGIAMIAGDGKSIAIFNNDIAV